MDISADLEELAKTNVLVVCAGAKSILDLGLTLEYLETRGVPVIGYQTEELPAFYTRSSGFKTDCRMDSPKEIAEAFNAKLGMGLQGGMVGKPDSRTIRNGQCIYFFFDRRGVGKDEKAGHKGQKDDALFA